MPARSSAASSRTPRSTHPDVSRSALSTLRVVIDPRIDAEALRTERLARLQTAMAAHGLEACLLFGEPNVRYATGAITMPVWSMSTFTRCAVVPAEGAPILFEHPNSMHRVDGVDVRPMHAWEFYDDAVRTRTGSRPRRSRRCGSSASTGVESRSTGWAHRRSWRCSRRVHVGDSSPATQEAREVKTQQEIALFRLNGPIVVEALGEFEAALRPGITERELFAVLAGGMLRRGAEYLATNTVCRGRTRTRGAPKPPPGRRGRGSRLPRHRHGRDRRLLLLRLADVRVR